MKFNFKRKKIGIFYICTGKYDIFWETFYKSSQRFFCRSADRRYFVFTDSKEIKARPDVTVIHQERLGWPDDTLMRFHMFNRAKNLVDDCDFLFFFNANMKFIKRVTTKQILPSKAEEFVGVRHPYYYETAIGAPFENNEQSLAFVHPTSAKHYVQGCLNGGSKDAYLKMSQELADNIDLDKKNGIVAVWHDESHLNAYYAKKNQFKALHPGFATPEARVKHFPFKPKIIQLDKSKLGGFDHFRS